MNGGNSAPSPPSSRAMPIRSVADQPISNPAKAPAAWMISSVPRERFCWLRLAAASSALMRRASSRSASDRSAAADHRLLKWREKIRTMAPAAKRIPETSVRTICHSPLPSPPPPF